MTVVEIIRMFNSLPFVILALGTVIGLFLYKHMDSIHRAVYVYIVAMLITDVASRYIRIGESNHIILLIYSLLELILLLYFYYNYLFKGKHRFLLVLSLIGMFYITWELFNYLFFKTEAKQFQPYAKVVDDFIIILLALTFFLESMSRNKDKHWQYFKLNAIVLIFFTINLIFFLPFNFLVNESSGLKFYIWAGFTLVLFLFYSYLTYAIWRNGKENLTN